MAKFCTKCGKPLIDGKPCNCEKNKNEDIKERIINIFKKIFITPFDTIKEYNNTNNLKLPLILLGINILIFGLFIYLFLYSLNKGIIKNINEISNIFGGNLYTANKVPFFESFLARIIIMITFLFTLCLMSKLFVSIVFKNNKKFKDYLVLYGISTPITIIATIIASIGCFISYKIGIVIALLGTTLYFVSTIQVLLKYYKIDKEKIPYILALTLTATYIITFIVPIITINALIIS